MQYQVYLAITGLVGFGSLMAGEQPPPSKAGDELKLSPLQVRCQKMLDMQIAVQDGTRALHKIIEAHADKKPRPDDRIIAVKLAGKQKAIISEATATIELLKVDGTADAFPKILEQIRMDMLEVQSRLKINDVGKGTQAIQTDIIDSLREMIHALKPCMPQKEGT